jgi:hypothetical protein
LSRYLLTHPVVIGLSGEIGIAKRRSLIHKGQYKFFFILSSKRTWFELSLLLEAKHSYIRNFATHINAGSGFLWFQITWGA